MKHPNPLPKVAKMLKTSAKSAMTLDQVEARLSDLRAAKKSDKLSPDEKAEMKTLIAEKAKLRAEKALIKANQLRARAKDFTKSANKINRERDSARKCLIGAYAVQAGMREWDDALIRGVFLAAAELTDAVEIERLRDKGGAQFNAEIQSRRDRTADIKSSFPAEPSRSIRIAMAAKGLVWDSEQKAWIGRAIPDEIFAIGGASVQIEGHDRPGSKPVIPPAAESKPTTPAADTVVIIGYDTTTQDIMNKAGGAGFAWHKESLSFSGPASRAGSLSPGYSILTVDQQRQRANEVAMRAAQRQHGPAAVPPKTP